MKTARLAELDALLDLEHRDEEIINDEPGKEVAYSGVRQYAR